MRSEEEFESLRQRLLSQTLRPLDWLYEDVVWEQYLASHLGLSEDKFSELRQWAWAYHCLYQARYWTICLDRLSYPLLGSLVQSLIHKSNFFVYEDYQNEFKRAMDIDPKGKHRKLHVYKLIERILLKIENPIQVLKGVCLEFLPHTIGYCSAKVRNKR